MKQLLCIASLSLLAASAPGADVKVVVKGVDRPQGTLLVGIFANAAEFPFNQSRSLAIEVKHTGTLTGVAKGLAPGIYAIAIIWDQNRNGALDTRGPFKMPAEPYGFSNNPKTRFGPPTFDECAFQVRDPAQLVEIVLKR